MHASDDTKLGELLLLLAQGLEDEPAAGATKLNKLAFYAELTHIRKTGRPITSVEYQRLPNGPAPRRLVPVRDRLIAEGAAELKSGSYLGRPQHRLIVKREPRRELFCDSEIEAIEEVLESLGGKSGAYLSELSHREPGWQLVNDGETIPLETAFLRAGHLSSRAVVRGRELARQYSSG